MDPKKPMMSQVNFFVSHASAGAQAGSRREGWVAGGLVPPPATGVVGRGQRTFPSAPPSCPHRVQPQVSSRDGLNPGGTSDSRAGKRCPNPVPIRRQKGTGAVPLGHMQCVHNWQHRMGLTAVPESEYVMDWGGWVLTVGLVKSRRELRGGSWGATCGCDGGRVDRIKTIQVGEVAAGLARDQTARHESVGEHPWRRRMDHAVATAPVHQFA